MTHYTTQQVFEIVETKSIDFCKWVIQNDLHEFGLPIEFLHNLYVRECVENKKDTPTMVVMVVG